ncbi:MAG: hypothetical protein HYV39_03500 [Candidatus Levybacteria bacterium]|nr:hypothetical protein [Candidatus Levybacteria bacterium]
MNSNNNGGGFSHGFLLGIIIGGGVVFLLGTKKGKKLLKTITEEGLEGIAELEDLVEDEALEQEDTPPAESKSEESPRRLFKGIPKKS